MRTTTTMGRKCICTDEKKYLWLFTHHHRHFPSRSLFCTNKKVFFFLIRTFFLSCCCSVRCVYIFGFIVEALISTAGNSDKGMGTIGFSLILRQISVKFFKFGQKLKEFFLNFEKFGLEFTKFNLGFQIQ